MLKGIFILSDEYLKKTNLFSEHAKNRESHHNYQTHSPALKTRNPTTTIRPILCDGISGFQCLDNESDSCDGIPGFSHVLKINLSSK